MLRSKSRCSPNLAVLLLAAVAAVLPACGGAREVETITQATDYTSLSAPVTEPAAAPASSVRHSGPHGGLLVPVGAAKAHLELIHSPESGRLRVYVLGPDAVEPRGVAENTLHAFITHSHASPESGGDAGSGDTPSNSSLADTLPARARRVELLLMPESEFPAPQSATSSSFAVISEALRGVETFSMEIERITIDGATYRAIRAEY